MLSADAKVRQCGAEAYIRVPGARRIAVLARLLDDPHPGVRGSVREAMFKLAQRPELAEPIRRAGSAMLAGDRWRGLEQAALLLAALDEKSAAPRLVELLEFSRPEVGIAAGWGLKTLALSETLPAMLDKASRNTEVRKSRPAPPGLDEQTAHLFEAFGRMEYRSAEPLLRRYVPKDYDMGAFSRSSAIWSLGLLHAGVPDEGLAAELAARASDMASVPPEMPPVQLMSIVGIGRMKAVSQVKVLRRLAGPTFSPTTLGMTLRWALMEVTGEQLPEPEPFRKGLVGMFLEPLED
jgi:HEAT repeat protein